MKFNSQICTTRVQSERLLALGLKKETADMVHQSVGATPFNVWYKQDIEDNFYPAWSLHRLWELTNIKHIILDSADEIPKIYDVVIAYIESQIKEGVFNKNYLED